MALHTLAMEEIPQDPDWFYLLPVHSTFYTNKSMQLLFEQWGYQASIYNVNARMWFWFKSKPDIEETIRYANNRTSDPSYIFMNKFIDYWKE
jgi:hypothetical protein